ncbi:hypothetical protein A1QC_12780 [Vibrio rumoiensis 1S-45]|uniref:Glycosyltransferase 2-like domain-containing protein n=1 Tax=Vibrio rumoiensis 1S-45 TaxID=1188252 RepID=A0A1E5DZX4_9VIBR|nr:hypothetical protein A1QC_12780 [Vibrio rumoiensis 1S-45]
MDNTPSPSDYNLNENIKLITLNDNVGIAKALNIGIDYVKEQSYKYCLLLDQDSEPDYKLVNGLTEFFNNKSDINDIALIAPSYFDKALGRNASFIQKNKYTMGRTLAMGEEPIEASYVITSGTLLNLSCYDKIGPMNEELFIDFVDIEWCLRANYKGYKILGLPWLRMEHEIGDKPVKFLGKEYVNHSAIRHYYYFRNVFMLLRMKHVPIQWKVSEVFKYIPRFIVYAFSTENKREQVLYMTKGMFHGIIGRFGKLRG